MPVDRSSSADYGYQQEQQQYPQYGGNSVYQPNAPVYQQYNPEPRQYNEVQPLFNSPIPPQQTTRITVAAPAKSARKSCGVQICYSLFIFLVLIIAGLAIAAFVMAIILMTTMKREITTVPLYLDGPTPYGMDYTPFVVSYHPFSNASYNNQNGAVVTAGYGSVLDENKVMTGYSGYPFLVDGGSKTAPYKDGTLVVRQKDYQSIIITSFTKGSSRGTWENTFRLSRSSLSINSIEAVVRVKEDTWNRQSNYIVLLAGSDLAMYSLHFRVESNDVISFGQEQKIDMGTSATAIVIPNLIDATVIVAVSRSTDGSIFACRIQGDYSTTMSYTNIVPSTGPKVSLLRGSNSTNGFSYYFFEKNSNYIQYREVQMSSSYFSTLKMAQLSTSLQQGASIIQSMESQSFVVYTVNGGVLSACATRTYWPSYSYQPALYSCNMVTITTDMHTSSPNVQAVIAGSQIIFGYNNQNSQYVTKVVGAVGEKDLVLDTTAGAITNFSQYTTTPLMINVNNNTLGMIFPGTTTNAGARVITYITRGGLTPIGISAPKRCRSGQVDFIQKIGVFSTCYSNFITGARYFATLAGPLTTQKSDGLYAVGIALDSANINLNLYDV
jgi:hypothetical protein